MPGFRVFGKKPVYPTPLGVGVAFGQNILRCSGSIQSMLKGWVCCLSFVVFVFRIEIVLDIDMKIIIGRQHMIILVCNAGM